MYIEFPLPESTRPVCNKRTPPEDTYLKVDPHHTHTIELISYSACTLLYNIELISYSACTILYNIELILYSAYTIL